MATAMIEVNIIRDNDPAHIVCEPVKAPGTFFTVPPACLGSVVDADSMQKATVEIGRLQNLCADYHEEIARLTSEIESLKAGPGPTPLLVGGNLDVPQLPSSDAPQA